MKLLLALTLLLFTFIPVQGQETDYINTNNARSSTYFKYRLDSITTYSLDKNSNFWIKKRTTSFLYNNNGQLILFNESSVRFSQIFEYDDDKNLISITNQLKGAWSEEKQTYEYNQQGQMIQAVKYIRPGEDLPLIVYTKMEFDYNDKGFLETKHSLSKFNSVDNVWKGHEKSLYTYNLHDDLIQITNLKLNNNVWDTTGITNYEYLYNAQNNISKMYYFEKSQTFIKNFKYDQNGNQIQDNYSNNTEIIYSYDLSHDFKEVIMPPWYIFNDKIYSSCSFRLYYYYFDIHSINNMLTEKHSINEYGDEVKYIFHYSTQKVTAVKDVTENPITLFPNPSEEYISINFDQKYQNAEFELFDVQGSKILSGNVKNTQSISLAGIIPGIYFYNLYFDNQIKSGKLFKK